MESEGWGGGGGCKGSGAENCQDGMLLLPLLLLSHFSRGRLCATP